MAINCREQRAESRKQGARSKRKREKSTKLFIIFSMLYALCSMLVFGGCASLSQKETVLAVVDGEPITEEDLKYTLNIAHRREDLSSAGYLDLSQYVQKLIDDRLIFNEERSAGMDKLPEVQKAVDAYILRESVVRLHNEEIVQKVSVAEKEIKDNYKKNYEKFTLGLIECRSEGETKDVLEKLRKGEDFKELARNYSTHSSRKNGGEIVLTMNALPPDIKNAVSTLKPDELSDLIKVADRFYIVKLIGSKEAPDEEFNNVKGIIEKEIRKQKEKERGDEYLKYLREKSTIKVDRDILSSVKLDGSKEETEKWSKDTRPLAEVNGTTLTAGDFLAMITPAYKNPREDLLEGWIDRKVVDHEALGRHYIENTDLKKMVYRYENQLLKNTFIKRVIIPQIVVSEKAMEEYYSQHQKSFLKPVRFKIQQITVKSMEEAQEILNNLNSGADFAWIAKRKSADSAASKGGDAGWFRKAELPKPVQEAIDTLKTGDISPVITIDSYYRIFRIQEKTGEEVEEFDKVKNAVYKACFNEQANALLDKYINQLKTGAQIKIYEDKIRWFEEKFKQ